VTRCEGERFEWKYGVPRGFAIGTSKRLRVSIYDKVFDCISNNRDSAYCEAMKEKRWGGLPRSATRVEWQMRRTYLKQYGLESVGELKKRLPDLFAKITGDEGIGFRITAYEPDRKNSHQSRVPHHPIWNRVIEIGREAIGEALEPLKRIQRDNLDESKALRQALGYLTSIAARHEVVVESVADIGRLIEELCRRLGISDSEIAERWERKAKESGAWDNIFSFPPEEAA
jgi:hypothetical protein